MKKDLLYTLHHTFTEILPLKDIKSLSIAFQDFYQLTVKKKMHWTISQNKDIIKDIVLFGGAFYELSIKGCTLHSRTIVNINKYAPNIVVLRFISCNTPEESSKLNVKNLRELDLTRCYSPDNEFVIKLLCNTLEILNFRSCFGINQKTLLQVSKICSNLQTLILRGCTQVTDYTILKIVEKNRYIEVLDLWLCDNITDSSILGIAKYCKKLIYLRIRGCFLVTSSSIIELLKSCPLLKLLDLQSCYKVNSSVLETIVLQNHKLETLNIINCSIFPSEISKFKKQKNNIDVKHLLNHG